MDDQKYWELFPFRKCEHENNDNLVVVLFKKRPTFIEKIFFRKMIDNPYKIDLDEIGSFIWNLCDGKNNLNDILRKVKDYFGDKVDPAEERVLSFIKQMNNTKLIQLYEKQDKND